MVPALKNSSYFLLSARQLTSSKTIDNNWLLIEQGYKMEATDNYWLVNEVWVGGHYVCPYLSQMK